MPQCLWSLPTVPVKSNLTGSGDLTPSVSSLPEAGFLARGSNREAPRLAEGTAPLATGCHLWGDETKGTSPTKYSLNANFGLGTLFGAAVDPQLNRT